MRTFAPVIDNENEVYTYYFALYRNVGVQQRAATVCH